MLKGFLKTLGKEDEFNRYLSRKGSLKSTSKSKKKGAKSPIYCLRYFFAASNPRTEAGMPMSTI
jgi:hypothetical protein